MSGVATTTTTTATATAQEIYETTGDAAAALQVLQQSTARTKGHNTKDEERISKYNQSVLELILNGGRPRVAVGQETPAPSLPSPSDLDLLPKQPSQPSQPSSEPYHPLTEEYWIMAYNEALLVLAAAEQQHQKKGETQAGSAREVAIIMVWEYIHFLQNEYQNQHQQHTDKADGSTTSSISQGIWIIACQMGFLLIEGLLNLSMESPFGLVDEWDIVTSPPLSSQRSDGVEFLMEVIPHLEENATASDDDDVTSKVATNRIHLPSLMDWISNVVLEQISIATGVSSSSSASPSVQRQQQQYNALKFSMALYTARIESSKRSSSNLKCMEANLKIARKELKHAMEIFSTKLKQSSADASSAMSGSQASLAQSHTSSYQQHHHHQQQQSTNMTPILYHAHRAALNVKAHTEVFRNNIKKALILCGEAVPIPNNTANVYTTNDGNNQKNYEDDDDDDNDNAVPAGGESAEQALHFSNLAIAYATSKKPYLALHAWSKAIDHLLLQVRQDDNKDMGNDSINKNNSSLGAGRSSTVSSRQMVHPDGRICLDQTAALVWNAGLGSLQAQNFIAAYECFSMCLQQRQRRESANSHKAWKTQARVWLRLGEACIGMYHTTKHQAVEEPQQYQEKPNESFYNVIISKEGGEPKGIVIQNQKALSDVGPLAVSLGSSEDMDQLRQNPLPRARYAMETALDLLVDSKDSLAYLSALVSLAYVTLELKDYASALHYAEQALEERSFLTADTARTALFQRQQATARMYASEAACLLGDATASMKFLVGDGKHDAFDRLASELGGVTLETASRNSSGKRRLAKAQAMVRCSASAASASLGNLSAAKQLAMSARAYSTEGSYATRALVYCQLKDGNTAGALTLLRTTP